MEENIKMEQQLTEEQLQKTTGGCATCTYYSKQATLFTGIGSGHRQSAETALQAGNHSEAQRYINDANKAFASAEKYQGLLRTKIAEHG